MKEQITVSRNFKIITLLLIATGAVTFIFGLITDRQFTWANYLIANYYFLSLAMGGAFFFVIQSISQSGWSSAFKRVSEAMMSYIPFAAIFFLLLWFGMKDLYQWTHKDAVALDPVLQHKSVFMNIPFFFARMVIYFSLWISVYQKTAADFTCRRIRLILPTQKVLCLYLARPSSIQKYLFSFLQ